jgi:hypothetical protein
MKNTLKVGLLSGAAGIAILAGYPQVAEAQMYTTGPGVYLSLEGRYLMNRGDKSSDTPLSTVIPGGGVVPATVSGLKARASTGFGGNPKQR